MKILIITSEELNPSNLFSSSFEIAQAKVLREKGCDVSIISVNNYISILGIVLAVLKRFLNKKHNKHLDPYSIIGLIRLAIVSIYRKSIGKSTQVNRYIIDDITVFEGECVNVFPSDLKKTLLRNLWTKTGLIVFNHYIETELRPDVIHAHSRFLTAGLLAKEIKIKFNIPYVITEHSCSVGEKKIKRDLQLLAKDVYCNACRLITVSRVLGESIAEMGLYKLEKVSVIANVVDSIYLVEPVVDKDIQNKFSFLNIGSAIPRKNQTLLLHAFAKAFKDQKNVHLKIVGDGELTESLINISKTLKICDQVVFLGYRNKEEVRTIVDNSNVIVSSSDYETFGVTLIEALTRGKPVISTRCGGPNEIIEVANGLLINPRDIEDLSNGLLFMYNNFSNYDGAKIRKSALAKYGPDAIGDLLISEYKMLLNDNNN